MGLGNFHAYLHCSACDKVEFCDAVHSLEKLRSIGMLRRNADPNVEVLRTLFEDAVGQFPCSGCGSTGMIVCDEDPFDAAAWGDPVNAGTAAPRFQRSGWRSSPTHGFVCAVSRPMNVVK